MSEVAAQIREYLAEQPDDCREANRAALAASLRETGPVVHEGKSYSVDGDRIVVADAPAPEEHEPAPAADPAARPAEPSGEPTTVPAPAPGHAVPRPEAS